MTQESNLAEGPLPADLLPHQVEQAPLLLALEALDGILLRAFRRAADHYGPEAALDGLRGLHLGRAEIERAFAQAPGAPFLSTSSEQAATALQQDERFGWLMAACELTAFDAVALLLALAPEIDLRYERIYAYLQDDVTRKRPAADLVLNLLCESRDERVQHRRLLLSGALYQHHLLDDGRARDAAPLRGELRVDPQICRFLLGETWLDARLATFCVLRAAQAPTGVPETAESLRAARIAERILARGGSPRFHFEGLPGTGKLRAAESLASRLGLSILVADLRGACEATVGFDEALRTVIREAFLQDALLFLHGYDALADSHAAQALRRLFGALAAHTGIVVVAGNKPLRIAGPAPVGFCRVKFRIPDVAGRRASWEQQLAVRNVAIAPQELSMLAARYAITPDQIGEAVATACAEQRVAGAALPFAAVCAVVRAQCGYDLSQLAKRIEPRADWQQLVLAPDALAQLRELCQRAAHGGRVLDDWGFGRRLSLGKGVTALFAGPSGTGKTLAAEVVAHALGLDMYKIDLSGVVSKYIGETERNLDRVFRAAENANAVLFFDEADALFGKRSEVRDSHDRYANIEVAYLLQKMEEFEGVAILATNLRQNLDDAFTRRLAFTVHFPFPEEADRLDIWRSIWPVEVPLAADVDLAYLAREFPFSGGNIKNTALAAAYYAAGNGGIVTQAYLLHATRREYQKVGKTLVLQAAAQEVAR